VAEAVRIVEVGPRDGLQNEAAFVPTEDKVALIEHLQEAGLAYLEVSSFVHPRWIPQLADADEVFRRLKRREGVTYAALVPNARGLQRALAAGVTEIAVFLSASETHNQKNINKTIDETFPVLDEVVREATAAGLSVRGYVSTAFGCPYEGEVPLGRVLRVTERLLAMGVREVSIGDTIGIATPKQVRERFAELVRCFGAERLAGHFHDTRGTGLANVCAALEVGIRTFDSSVGGLGGCPYAPGASGNVATEELVYLLHGMGYETGIDLDRLVAAGRFIQERLGRKLPSRVLAACTAGQRSA